MWIISDYVNISLSRIMSNVKAKQRDLDEKIVPVADRLPIKHCNYHLPESFKDSKDSTFHVAHELIKQSSFYNTFIITGFVPEIYMQ